MKKGEIYEGVIEKVDFPNKGYVNIDGEKVIVKNGIPGQKVRFMINIILIIALVQRRNFFFLNFFCFVYFFCYEYTFL